MGGTEQPEPGVAVLSLPALYPAWPGPPFWAFATNSHTIPQTKGDLMSSFVA